jgi:actin beta/gamma 1
MDFPRETVVIELGSHLIRAGFASDQQPRFSFRSVVRRSRALYPVHGQPVSFGDEMAPNGSQFSVSSPIKNGILVNLDDVELILRHVFDRLGVDPTEHPVLIIESGMNSQMIRWQLTELVFDTFNVPYFSLVQSHFLALFMFGHRTGLVVDVGQAETRIVPVYETFAISDATITLPLAGNQVDAYFWNLLYDKVFLLTNMSMTRAHVFVRDIKEKSAYVADNFNVERARPLHTTIAILPDGQEVEINSELFTAPELLFQPSLDGISCDSIGAAVVDSIMKCDVDIRRQMSEHIVLVGGTTLIPGLPERIKRDITDRAPGNFRINVIAVETRQHTAWIGGAMFPCDSVFPKMVMTKEEYDEIRTANYYWPDPSRYIQAKFIS